MSDDGLPWAEARIVTAVLFATLGVLAVLEVALGPNPLSENTGPIVAVVIGGWGVRRLVSDAE